MAAWKNTSGSTVSVPIVEHDVAPNEIVTVPDDVIMSPEYFTLQ